MVREILVDWTTPSGPGLTVTYWDDAQPVNPQRNALLDWLTAMGPLLNNQYAWSIRQSGKQYSTGSGELQSLWNDPGAGNGTGTSNTAYVPDATQVLIRWGTGAVINGRVLRGRSFIPGLISSNVEFGGLKPSAVVDFDEAATEMFDGATGFSVWHRPTGGVFSGSIAPVTSASTWNQLAVQRRRRT